MLALREKDGMQLALLVLGIAAELHGSGKTLVERYCELLVEKRIQYRYSNRQDLALYDESLEGAELQRARRDGTRLRDSLVAFFRGVADGMSRGALSADVAREQLALAADVTSDVLPELRAAHWIGDGSMFEWEGARLIVRASGTDALMRYYIDGIERNRVERLGAIIRNFRVPG